MKVILIKVQYIFYKAIKMNSICLKLSGDYFTMVISTFNITFHSTDVLKKNLLLFFQSGLQVYAKSMLIFTCARKRAG